MTRPLPAGAVGMCRPTGIIGRIIAWRQGMPYSHAVVALGNGRVWESTWRWTRITEEPYWTERDPDQTVDWWAPTEPCSAEQERVLKSVAYFTAGRIRYGLIALLAFVIRGVPGKRGHDLFCTYGVAEMYMSARDFDFSGCEQPWNLNIRELYIGLIGDNFERVEP